MSDHRVSVGFRPRKFPGQVQAKRLYPKTLGGAPDTIPDPALSRGKLSSMSYHNSLGGGGAGEGTLMHSGLIPSGMWPIFEI